MDTVSERSFTSTIDDFGVEYSLPILRSNVVSPKHNNNIGLVFHRTYFDMCYSNKQVLQNFPLSNGKVRINV